MDKTLGNLPQMQCLESITLDVGCVTQRNLAELAQCAQLRSLVLIAHGEISSLLPTLQQLISHGSLWHLKMGSHDTGAERLMLYDEDIWRLFENEQSRVEIVELDSPMLTMSCLMPLLRNIYVRKVKLPGICAPSHVLQRVRRLDLLDSLDTDFS